MDEGPLVEAQLTDVNPGELEVGMRVEMVTRKLREHGEAGLLDGVGPRQRPQVGRAEPRHRPHPPAVGAGLQSGRVVGRPVVVGGERFQLVWPDPVFRSSRYESSGCVSFLRWRAYSAGVM